MRNTNMNKNFFPIVIMGSLKSEFKSKNVVDAKEIFNQPFKHF